MCFRLARRMKKINVIGTTGSGKSRFSTKLAKALECPYIEMDKVFWKPNWREPSTEEFLNSLECELKNEKWVLDGNYSRTNELKWSKADTVIWLNYSYPRTLYQILKRSISRAIYQQELWPNTGNRETFGKLFSKESIVLWFFKNYSRNKYRYPKLFKCEQFSHINFIILNSPKEANEFIEKHTWQSY